MRQIPLRHILCTNIFMMIIIGIALVFSWQLAGLFGWDWQADLLNGIVLAAALIPISAVLCRVLDRFLPLKVGTIHPGSKQEFRFNIQTCIRMFFYVPLAESKAIPAPLTRTFYRLWGAKLGRNSFPALCGLADPQFIEAGKNVIFGAGTVITPHILSDNVLSHQIVTIGDNVTIGVGCVIFGGTVLGDGSLILANSTVLPDSVIGEYEVWGGESSAKDQEAHL